MHEKELVVFQDKKIRRTWFNDEWWFVAIDIIEVLTDSRDPSGYLKDMRKRDEGFAERKPINYREEKETNSKRNK